MGLDQIHHRSSPQNQSPTLLTLGLTLKAGTPQLECHPSTGNACEAAQRPRAGLSQENTFSLLGPSLACSKGRPR